MHAVLSLPRTPTARKRVRRILLALALAISVPACQSIEKALPYLIVAGGAIASVVALNFMSIDATPLYTSTVLATIGTLTTVASAASDAFVDSRQKARELAELEKADSPQVEKQYAALQAAAPPGNPAGWTTAWGSSPANSEPARWESVAPVPAFQQSSGGESPWGNQPNHENQGGQANPYGNGGVMTRSGGSPLAIDVAMIKRAFVAGQERMIEFEDGAVLLDGRGENVEDRFRLFFSPTEDAYVYIVGVDAVGRVQPLFPRRFPDQTNPIRAGERVLLPDGTNWYGLDEFAGIQHIFVRAGREPNKDLEMQLTLFAATPPPALPTTGKIYTVSEAMTARVQSKGITGIEGDAVKLPPEIGELEFRPTRVQAQDATQDVAAVRYFQHG